MTKNRLTRSLRVTFIGMIVNVFLAVAKLIAGLVGNSYALIADAVESLADVCSSIIVWRGVVVAAEPADADHPYGHGKAEPIAAAMVAGILLFAAIGISVQAIRDIITPRNSPEPFTLVVLLAVVMVKEGLFRLVFRAGIEIESTVVQTDAWHHRSDALTSFAAAIGISVAILGGPRFVVADSIAAIVAAIIIAWNGSKLLRNAVSELMDAVPTGNLQIEIRDAAKSVPGVDEVEKCIVRKIGYDYFVDMHVEVDPLMSVQRAHDIAHQVKDRVRQSLPAIKDVLVHVEPSNRTPSGDQAT